MFPKPKQSTPHLIAPLPQAVGSSLARPEPSHIHIPRPSRAARHRQTEGLPAGVELTADEAAA
jgi:hypothetical protein